jgi:lantibiotic modifying enzyme
VTITDSTIPEITIPSLRPHLLGAPFPGTELPTLPAALAEVQLWIDAAEERVAPGASRWHAWPDRPEFEPIYGPVSLNTGAAGIAWYSLAAADATGETGHADRARRAARYIEGAWREHVEDEPLNLPGLGLGHYGGLAGIATVIIEVAGREPQYRATAVAMLDEILARTGVIGGRPDGWTGFNAMLGDGGIVINLVDAADRLGEPRYLEAAVAAGRAILAEERSEEHGGSWPGVPARAFGLDADIELDGFELGTVGVAFVFAKLAMATGDERFRKAAVRAATYVTAGATKVGDAAVLPRIGGDISFGYCTGSSGVIRSLLGVYRASGDEEHLEWALRFGRGILRSGVPGRQTPGNAFVFHQCCGSAAVLESFIGLWLETGDPLWLDAAKAQGDDLLIRSVSDEKGRRWYSESHVLPVGTHKAEVGHQVGASGIALALLRLHQAVEADAGGRPFATIRLPDDPFSRGAEPS